MTAARSRHQEYGLGQFWRSLRDALERCRKHGSHFRCSSVHFCNRSRSSHKADVLRLWISDNLRSIDPWPV